MAAHKLSRLILLLKEVKTNPWQTVTSLCKTLGIGRAQFYRDKQALKEIEFVFDYSRTERRFLITKDVYVPVYNLTLSETFALTMAVRQLSAAGDFILTYDAIEAIRKIVTNAPTTQRELLVSCLDDTVLQAGFGCKPRVLEELRKAVLEERRIKIYYTPPPADAPKEYTLDPYQIFFKRRALYLDAYDTEDKVYKVFRVSRISEVQPTGMIVPRRTDYNFTQRHRHAFSVFVGDAVQRVRVRFTKRIAPLIRETCWHHSQQLTEEPDGGLLFEVEVNEPHEVGWWALQWGADAEVLEPESLRRELHATAQRLLGLYAKRAATEEELQG